MWVFLIYFIFGLFQVFKKNTSGKGTETQTCKTNRFAVISYNKNEVRTNASVWLHAGKQRPHILRGQKGYINQPCD